MNRTTISIICLSAYFLLTFSSDQIGVSMSQHGDKYHFSAGTSLIALVESPFLFALLTAYKPKGRRETSGTIVSLWRRFCAFIIDFFIALLPASAILAFPAILVEWHHTDIFVWQFSREFSRATDVFTATAPALLGFAWLLFYFSYPITKGDQTVGQYIIGYRIALKNNDNVPVKKAILRTIFSFFCDVHRLAKCAIGILSQTEIYAT